MGFRRFSGLCLFSLSIWFPSRLSAAELQVISRTPVERTESARASAAITATFNQPMIPLNDPAAMGDYCPIRIEPTVKGRCRWQGTQTLSFEPEGQLPPAHRYKVTIPKGSASKVSGAALVDEVSWEFETLRPQVVTSKPTHDDRWVNLNPIFFVQFNLPMNPRRIADYITLEERPLDNAGTSETISLGARMAKAEEIKSVWPYSYYGIVPSTANVVALKPSRSLKPDHAYTLQLKEGLPPAEGDLGLLAARGIAFETYYSFRAVEFPSKECLPHWFRMAFSNPVKYQELLDHMSVEPSTPMPRVERHIAEPTGSQERHTRRVYQSMPDIGYKPDAVYSFKIDKNLEDIFGNKLGDEVTFQLATDGFCPRVEMPQGFGILESYLPLRHPLTLVNVSQVPIEMARIPDDQLVPFYESTRWSSYEPTSLSLSGGVTAGITNLVGNVIGGSNSVKKTLDFSLPRNARYRGYIDVNQVLRDSGGFAFTQVESKWGRSGRTEWLKSLDNVTRLGLTFKNSPDSILLWTSFLRTGSPAGRIPVELRDAHNKVLWQGQTDNQGFAKAPGWAKLGIKDTPNFQRPKLWAFAKDAKGSAALTVDWRGGIEPWRFNLPYEWAPRAERYRGLMFTERGVYRPGEKVYIKGLVRKLEDGDWAPSDIQRLQVVLTDARGAEVLKTTVTVSANSSFDLEYQLKEEAPTGAWTLRATEVLKEDAQLARPVQSDEEEGYTRSYVGRAQKIDIQESFRVEAFKPASFEVKVTPQQTSYFLGDTFKATVDGWYLFGAPMTDAAMEWKLRMSPGFYAPPGFDEFNFGGGWWEDNRGEGRLIGSGTEELDSNGKAAVDAKLVSEGALGPLQAVLEASITSPDRQRLFGRATVNVHRANLYLGLKQSKYFAETGKDWSAHIVALRPDGVSASRLPVTGHLIHRQWMSIQRAGVAGRLEWVSEQRDTVVSTFTYTSSPSTFTWTTRVDQSGQYILKVSGKDEEKRMAESSISFYAMGAGQSWWARSDTDIIEVVPDKKKYKPGDSARLLVKSPYPRSRVLVTLEREGIMEHWLTTLEGTSNIVTVPLKDSHVPNVFVGIMLVQGRSGTDRYSEVGDDVAKPEAKFGYVNLAVDPGGRRLTVRVKTDKTSYRPRERVTVSLQTLTEQGALTPAEVTVYAVDEGVLALTGYSTPDPLGSFYGPRSLLVDTADSRLHIIGQRSFGEKGENRGGGGGTSRALEGVDLRSRFVPTAFWKPSVMTNAQGMTQLSFVLPDNLSRFRVMAVASSGKRFGSGDSKLTVSKPLLLRPSLPRFARVGDKFQGGVVLHNYTSQTVKALIGIEQSGTAIQVEGAAQREIQVGAGKALEVLWNCKAVALGQHTFRFRAAADKETDGLEWKIPVKPVERLQVVATSGVTEREAKEEIEKPKDIILELGGLTATLSPTALAGLQEGARFLLEYPYGCLEQRLSRSLPVIVGADLIATFKLGTVGDLKAEVQKQLNNLSDYQHPNGGFGYWPNPWKPDPYITAYALEVAHLAGKEGYKLPETVLARASTWMKSYLSSKQEWAYPYSESEDYCARAYTLYVLGLRGEAPSNYFANLYQRRDQIPYCGKAYLFKAAPLVMSDSGALQTLSSELLNQARMSPTTLHFEEPSETRMPWIHESTVLTTARVLQAFLETKGGFPSDEKTVRWLIGERKAKSRWRTTCENAAALRALQDYYRRYEKDEPRFKATLSKGDSGRTQEVWHESFQGRTLSGRSKTFTLPALFGSGDKARLTIRKEGTGRLYYTLRLRYAPVRMDKPASEGLSIERTVKPLYGSGKEVRAGARAVVTLTVRTPQDRTFVAVEDPLPGGFEIVDPTFAVEGHEDVRTMRSESARGPYWGTFHRSEKYDDRILVFADFLAAGEHTYSYLVQATTPGQFSTPATTIEQMYEPEVFGHTASDRVEIRK